VHPCISSASSSAAGVSGGGSSSGCCANSSKSSVLLRYALSGISIFGTELQIEFNYQAWPTCGDGQAISVVYRDLGSSSHTVSTLYHKVIQQQQAAVQQDVSLKLSMSSIDSQHGVLDFIVEPRGNMACDTVAVDVKIYEIRLQTSSEQ
jgi:hypothetical protein